MGKKIGRKKKRLKADTTELLIKGCIVDNSKIFFCLISQQNHIL